MWLSVCGYEGFYEVNENGDVRRIAPGQGARPGRLISTKQRNAKGYRVVELCVNASKKRVFLHRIVCSAFHGSAPSLSHVVNHIDGVKENCAARNLEWVTPKENSEHAWRIGLCQPLLREANGRARLTSIEVEEIRQLRGRVGARKIAKRFGVCRSTIQKIHQTISWK